MIAHGKIKIVHSNNYFEMSSSLAALSGTSGVDKVDKLLDKEMVEVIVVQVMDELLMDEPEEDDKVVVVVAGVDEMIELIQST